MTQESINQQIIKGAGDATEAGNITMSNENLAMEGNAYNELGYAAGNLIADQLKKKKEKEAEQKLLNEKNLAEWDKFANEAMKAGEGLTQGEYKDLFKQLEAERLAFIDASPEEKAVILSRLDERDDKISDVKEFRGNLADSFKDIDGIKANEEFLTSLQGADYKGILSGENQMISENGDYGYMLYDASMQEQRITNMEALNAEIENLNNTSEPNSGGVLLKLKEEREKLENEIYKAELMPSSDRSFNTIDDLNATIKNQSFDRASNTLITEMAENAEVLGGSVAPGRNMGFKYEKTYNLINSDILANGVTRSLWKDKHIGGVSAETNLLNAIQGQTYSDFNITKEQLLDMDPTDDDKISDDDAVHIVQQFFKDKDMASDYLARYFTNFVEQNYIQGYKGRSSSDTDGNSNGNSSSVEDNGIK